MLSWKPTASNLLIATNTRWTPIKEQMVRWRKVWVRTPFVASTKTIEISARDAATAILRVYCSCPGASEMIKRRPSRSDMERYATSIVIPCSRSASRPSVSKLKSISPAGIIEPARRTFRVESIVS